MSDYDASFDEDEDDYFSEVIEGAELTGLEPKFVRIDAMSIHHAEFQNMKVDELIRLYIAARNQLATDRKGYKAREAAVKGHMAIISMALRDRGDSLGVDNFKTNEGTAYRNVKEKFTVQDWEGLCAYVKESGNFSVLQKRVSPNAVKEARELEGSLPAGVGTMTEVEFAVRSPTVRKSK